MGSSPPLAGRGRVWEQMSTSKSFQQLARRFTDVVQDDCGVIRGIMLAHETITERSRVTGVDRDTISEKALRFLEGGMVGLVDRRTTSEKGRHRYPGCTSPIRRLSWLSTPNAMTGRRGDRRRSIRRPSSSRRTRRRRSSSGSWTMRNGTRSRGDRMSAGRSYPTRPSSNSCFPRPLDR